MAPMDGHHFLVNIDFFSHFVASHTLSPTLYPYRSACGIGYSSEKLSQMTTIQLAIHLTVGVHIDRLV